MTFGEAVKLARHHHGMTQTELAVVIGVSLLTIQNIERGSPPKLSRVESLMDVLGMQRIGGTWILGTWKFVAPEAYKGAPKPGRKGK